MQTLRLMGWYKLPVYRRDIGSIIDEDVDPSREGLHHCVMKTVYLVLVSDIRGHHQGHATLLGNLVLQLA